MEALAVRDLSFTYPQQDSPAVRHASFSLQQGEFAVLCGPSGCGKTTLLRQMKTVMAPKGILSGEVFVGGNLLADMDLREQSMRIGFVQQQPENQVVTDKVWHELAFGLESLGLEWKYVSRTRREGMFAYEEIDKKTLQEYRVIVNCSPVGMFPHSDECPAIPYDCLDSEHLLFDLVYNPEETLFMQKGRAQGATVKNGLEMLHLQAIASWRFWNE